MGEMDVRHGLGFDPLRAVGLRKGVAEEARFRVDFLSVT